MRYTAFFKRFLAHVIDSIIIYCFLKVIYWCLKLFSNVNAENVIDTENIMLIALYGAGFFLIDAPYEILSYCSKYQATIGKRVVGIVVLDVNGERISFMRAVLRFLATFPSAISLVGYLMVLFTRKKQTMHDMLAGTVVCYKK